MAWSANSPVVGVMLALGITWITPQFLVAFAAYTIVMALFVTIIQIIPALSFFSSNVSVFAVTLSLGFLAIVSSSMIRAFVYKRAAEASENDVKKRLDKQQSLQRKKKNAEVFNTNYTSNLISMHGFKFPLLSSSFYWIFLLVMAFVWALTIAGSSALFYYESIFYNVWPYVFLIFGCIVAVAMTAVVMSVYNCSETRCPDRRKCNRGKLITIIFIVTQFPLIVLVYLPLYVGLHQFPLFSSNEIYIALIGIAAYFCVDWAVVISCLWGVDKLTE